MTLHIIHLILSWVDFKGRNKMNYLFSTKDNNSGNEVENDEFLRGH